MGANSNPTDRRNLTFVFYDSAEIYSPDWASMQLGLTEFSGFCLIRYIGSQGKPAFILAGFLC